MKLESRHTQPDNFSRGRKNNSPLFSPANVFKDKMCFCVCTSVAPIGVEHDKTEYHEGLHPCMPDRK